MTYPEAAVRETIERTCVPVRLDVLKERDLAKRLRATWTPLFLFLDADGREGHRWLGFLPPKEFIPQILVGAGLTHFQAGRTDQAAKSFEEVLSEHADSMAAPEALYWSGVCGFRRTKDTRPIYEACKAIVERYPQSAWALKVGFVTRYKDFNLAGG